jgi:predicted RNA-binding Zn-ribbon protein involved in translation (DUF1610 family)
MTTTVKTFLEPPYSRSAASPEPGREPVLVAPILVRTRGMGRWHRPRSGIHYTDRYRLPWKHGSTSLTLWCGQFVHDLSEAVTADTAGRDLLCGTCEGRAVGAGYPPVGVEVRSELVFSPRSTYRTPAVCPGVKRRLVPDDRARAVACPACGELVALRASTRGYDFDVNLQGHPPGDGLVPPCPFHSWDELILCADGSARCACQRGAAS